MTRKTTTAPATAPAPRAWIWTLVITASVYASSSLHRLAGGDSGELLAEACVGSNAHPPGYPLLLLMLGALRFIGSYACPHVPFVVMANYLNAAFAASAAACVTHVVELLVGHGHTIEAISAGLLFAFSALTWEYALGLEVFALNNLLVGLLLVCFVCHVVDYQSKQALYMGAFVSGLGLANQHTLVLFEAPMILWIVASTKLGLLDWIYLTVAFTAGLSPYAHTLSAAQTPTQGSWGDASTLHGLVSHILRREYGTFQLSPMRGPSDSLLTRLVFYATDVVSELTVPGILCALIGALSAFEKPLQKTPLPPPHRRPIKVLLVVLVIYVLVFNSLANLPLDDPLPREVTRRFFLQPNLLIAVMSGLGLSSLRRWCNLQPSKASLISPLFTTAMLGLVTYQLLRHRDEFTATPIARHDLLRGFGHSILHDLPSNALLLSYTDVQWNTVRYLQKCEHQRPDVVHLNLQLMAFPWFQKQHTLYPTVTFPLTQPDVSTNRSSQGYATYLSHFILANLQRHALFLDLHGVDESTITSDQLLFNQLQVLPHGFVWHVVQAAASSSRRVDHWRTYATLDMPRSKQSQSLLVHCCGLASHTSPLPIPRGSWEFVVVSIAHDAMYQHALAKLGYWLGHNAIQTVQQLEQIVVALETIQHELNAVVWAGVQHTDGAITYDVYAVEKNAVVSRQRLQLYLEVLAELIQQGHDVQAFSKQIQELQDQRETRREETIGQVEAFLKVMERERDSDTDAIRQGLETLYSKLKAPTTALKKKNQRKKRRKIAPSKRV